MRRPLLALLAAPAGFAGYVALGWLLRPWYRRWGATDDEMQRSLPGDELVPQPLAQSTWAVFIDAPPGQVWPWLVQTGQERAGFYTYQWFENGVLHLDIHNADRIVPEWQDVRVGHRIWFYPESYVIEPRGGPRVVAIEPNRAFILCHQVSTDETSCPGTWQFVLTPVGEGATRLILRARSGPSPTRAFDLVAELGYFVLTRGMLLGIKQRAESMAA